VLDLDIAPLTLPEFGASLAAIGGFETRPLVAVAVSGGPDSMALMLLADRWARTHGGRAWGLTVDHGLRRESADEARTVATWLGARAIPHEILCWVGSKPASGIQEAARDARYNLLTSWCRVHSCLHLLTAHHREDQIETHLIRRRAGSGIDGLAGMSAVRELPGCRLVRPLLSVSRRRLAALLAAEGQPFLRDPSNLNPVFERARLRLGFYEKAPSPLPGERVGVRGRVAERLPGPSPGSPLTGQATLGSGPGQALSRTAGESFANGADLAGLESAIRICARERIARERALNALIARALALHPAGFGVLDPAVLAAANPETAARLLSRAVSCLGGARYPARAVRLARLRAALAEEPRRARTLSGCRFVPWRGRLLVLRELALAEAPIALEPGADLRWDRRFAASLSAQAAEAFTLGYLGQHAGAAPEAAFRRMLPPLVRSILPAFWDVEGIASVPHLFYTRPGSRVLPELSFRPAKPLTPPSFTVV
jgi:tRNA(Ile)-lysidine synthase